MRVDLTRSDSLRPGQVVGQRSIEQLHPGDRARALPLRDRVEHDRGAPGARAADQEGGAGRRDARRRRPAQDLADEAREAPSPAPPGYRRVADQRDAAHDPRRGAPERGLHRRVHGGLRRGARGRLPLPARGGGEDHRRPGRGDPSHRPRVRERAPRGDLLHARDHRARVRRRQHLVAQQSRARDRPPRLRVDGPERAPRPEQRPGAERLRREPALPAGLPALRRPRGARPLRSGLGRRGACARRLPPRPDDERAPRRPREGALPHRREPRADRAERAPRRGGPRQARVPDLAGHLPARHDQKARGRRLSGLVLCGEGRHVHEHRAPHLACPRGRAAAREREGRPRDRHPHGEGTRRRTGRSTRTPSRSGTSSPTSRRTGTASATTGSRRTGSSGR